MLKACVNLPALLRENCVCVQEWVESLSVLGCPCSPPPGSDGRHTTDGHSSNVLPLSSYHRESDTKPPHACCSLTALHGQTREQSGEQKKLLVKVLLMSD